MTSFRQIDANRRNARHSTGPVTEGGKQRSRCNAVRHGLTAETVIGTLEDAEDYRAFEAAVIADYDAQSAVERELVLRLASLLWRLRRSTSMETGLFEIQADHLRTFRQTRRVHPEAPKLVHAMHGRLARSMRTTLASRTASQTRKTLCRAQHRDLSIRLPTLRVVSCALPICQATRSTGSAVMKPSFGARPARSCSPSTHWNVANRRKDEAGSGADRTD